MRLNPDKMKRFLPCSKVEIIQTIEDTGVCRLYLAETVEQINDKKYELVDERFFDTFEDAYLCSLKWMLDTGKGKDVREHEFVEHNVEVLVKHIITVTEGVRGRDGGSSWADPYNDVVGTGKVKIETFVNRPEFHLEYETGYCSVFTLVGLSKAIILKSKMEDIYIPPKKDKDNYVAFSCNGYVFNDIKWLNDLRIAGTSCDKLYYSEYEDNNVGIFDLLEDYVFFQERNDIYYVGQNIYYNGEKIMSIKELSVQFPKYQVWQIKDSVPDDIVKYFAGRYPLVRNINSHNESRHLGDKENKI